MGNHMATYNKYKSFLLFIRKYKVMDLVPPQDLKEVFTKFSEGGSYMSIEQLRHFLVEHQGEEDCTLSNFEKIVEKVLQVRKSCHGNVNVDQSKEREITLEDLFHFLLHDDFNAPLKSEVHNDMSAPLSHYFIYTGHNSYLTGNQLSSDCSEEPIIKALKRGVRVIELDLWPTSNRDDIKVDHGWTLTNPVSVIKCLESIKEYAFVASQYPVIITIEDHLTTDLRAKFAVMVTQIFGEMLYYPETDYITEFPSPESLKNRVIISTKPPKECFESNRIKDNDNCPGINESESSSEEELWGKESPDSNRTEVETEGTNGSDRDEGDMNACECDHKSYQECLPEYKRIITIHNRKFKGSLKDKLKTDGELRRLSWSETTLEKASESHGTDIVRFTQKNILRVYPSAMRVKSSNFKPHIGWMYGAQMVAFNMQGMFRANGGCGYVKKPKILMQKHQCDNEFDPTRILPVKKKLKVKVYLGHGWSLDFSPTHFDKCSPPDFYAKIYIIGMPADFAKKKTKVIMDNWLPVWDEEFEFRLTVPELALLLIQVKDKDQGKDDFAGQTCLPVSELKLGFRSVPLHNKKGEKFKSVKLLIRFQLE
ncbi:phosphoinositide phospholipase C 6-like isoform X2 [Abrus precatorius]|uniref:Phosphoinositide phospholipase C n=1 Tax=Abrus precatorius TaxID=3816 RepID=A0A8B8JGZ1_ABRPR|nr:phosphoinositide phospholipase C 6-like isoform X2 [Abrus precatorius]